MEWKVFDTDDVDRIRGMQGDVVIVDPADLIELAEYLESITSAVYWGAGNEFSKRLREIVCQSKPC